MQATMEKINCNSQNQHQKKLVLLTFLKKLKAPKLTFEISRWVWVRKVWIYQWKTFSGNSGLKACQCLLSGWVPKPEKLAWPGSNFLRSHFTGFDEHAQETWCLYKKHGILYCLLSSIQIVLMHNICFYSIHTSACFLSSSYLCFIATESRVMYFKRKVKP